VKFREHRLAHSLLDGLSGLEIGASTHNPFGLQTRNVAPIEGFEEYACAHEHQLDETAAVVDIWGTAERIPVPADSEDYILNSHVVEHLPNVIGAFLEWNRIVRVGGYVFMIVPLPDALPADVGRPLTNLEHIIADYREERTLDSHPIDGVPGGRMGHYHVFTPQTLIDVVDWMKGQGLCDWSLVAREDVDTKVGNGFTLAFRIASKRAAGTSSSVEWQENAAAEVFDGRAPSTQAEWACLLNAKNRALKNQAASIAEKEKLLECKERDFADRDRLYAMQLEQLAARLRSEEGTLGWRALQFVRRVRNRLCPPDSSRRRILGAMRRLIVAAVRHNPVRGIRPLVGRLRRWRNQRSLASRTQMLQLQASLTGFRHQPTISLVTPVYEVDETWLRRAIETVRAQAYPHWELCLVNDGSKAAHIRPVLDEYAALDARIRVMHLERNAGIVGASNRGLEMATGDFIGLLDNDDELTPDALFAVVERLNEEPDLDLIYSDEDKISPDGRCCDPVFKPEWSPDLLLSCNYITHFSVLRTSLLRKIGGFRTGFDGSQDYDLLLRFTEQTQRIAHIPRILYHWRIIASSTASSPMAKPYAFLAARRALEEALVRRGQPGRVDLVAPGFYKVHYRHDQSPLVSLILLDRGAEPIETAKLVQLQGNSGHAHVEIVLVRGATANSDPGESCRIVECSDVDHVSDAYDRGARQARGELLLFLDACFEPAGPNWMSALLEQALRPEVGAVGAKLHDAKGRILHTGITTTPDGSIRSVSAMLARESINRHLYTACVRDCSAVSGGCLMIRRDVFEAIGGFDVRFRRNYFDLDLCLRLRHGNFAVIYTPWAVFRQTDSASNDPLLSIDDERLRREKWGSDLTQRDPFFNPNLVANRRVA
jgi:GT2 family glycosyltransferase